MHPAGSTDDDVDSEIPYVRGHGHVECPADPQCLPRGGLIVVPLQLRLEVITLFRRRLLLIQGRERPGQRVLPDPVERINRVDLRAQAYSMWDLAGRLVTCDEPQTQITHRLASVRHVCGAAIKPDLLIKICNRSSNLSRDRNLSTVTDTASVPRNISSGRDTLANCELLGSFENDAGT